MKLSEVEADATSQQPQQATGDESAWSSVWKALGLGAKRGAQDVLEGGAQIGVRMAQAPQIGQTEPEMPGRVGDIDRTVRQNVQAYQQDPRVQAHPWAAGIGRVGGNIAANLPLAAVPGGAETLGGRAALGALGGAAAGATQPVTEGNFAAQKALQMGTGAGIGAVAAPAAQAAGTVIGQKVLPALGMRRTPTPPASQQPFQMPLPTQPRPGQMRLAQRATPPWGSAEPPGTPAGVALSRETQPGPLVEAGRPEASDLATNLIKDDPIAVDRQLTRSFSQAVRPRGLLRPTAGTVTAQERNITNAVDRIIANKNDLKLTDEGGVELPAGSLPKSLYQFMEAIDQTKQHIFSQYDELAQRAAGPSSGGPMGVKVPLAPAIAELRAAGAAPEVATLHPNLTSDANRMADEWSKLGTLTPKETQKMIQNLNALRATQPHTLEAVNQVTMLQPVIRTLRATLDKTIEDSQGPGYQALKNQYGALTSIEKDVATAMLRNARNVPGGLAAVFGDLGAMIDLLHGVATLNPAQVGKAVAIKGAQQALKWIKSPNRAVQRMFSKRAAPSYSTLGIPTATYAPLTTAGRIGAGLGQGPAGGDIIVPPRRLSSEP